MLFDVVNCFNGLCQFVVDFIVCWKCCYLVVYQFVQCFFFQVYQFGDQQLWDYVVVVVSEIMEIVVGVYFVIVDGVFFVYMFFNKGVFGF